MAVRDILSLNQTTLFAESSSRESLQNDRIKVITIGPEHSKVNHGDWRRICGVEESGDVLVRPHGIVAWRGEMEGHTAKSWIRLIDQVLGYR